MEEMSTNITTTEETTDVTNYENNQQEESRSVTPLIIGGVILGAVGAGSAYLYKKFKGNKVERQIKSLEKAGYTITPPEVCEGEIVENEEPEETSEEK